MVGKRKAGKTRANKKAAAAPTEQNVASRIYEEMLGEAAAPDEHPSERPLKKPRRNSLAARGRLRLFEPASPRTEDEQPLGEKEEQPPVPVTQTVSDDEGGSNSDDSDDDIEFEDVVLAPDFSTIDHSTGPAETPPAMVELDLSKPQAASAARAAARRSRPMTKEDRLRRLDIHKTHLLCLLVHCALRNHWCNDERAQNTLRPLLTDKMIKYLIPPSSLSQFGRTESLKKGLEQVSSLFRSKYQITERGVRRALWAESPEQLASLKEEPPDDLDSCATKDDFRRAARRLEGSRDVGAQLYCALLRSAGLEARLVCSLQVLGAAPGMPTRAAPAPAAAAAAAGKSRRSQRSEPAAAASGRESPFPVYWVEVLDVAHQRWQPTDPIVTGSYWKPRGLEPAGSDRENCLAYVVAFAEDGSARDVTRRYAKAYAAKTRRMRVEALEGDRAGERWWRRALSRFRRRPELLPWTAAGEATDLDLDQIEDGELAALEAREPMPRGMADFKDHPVYALERHLRRAEVLVPGARRVGTVGVGSSGALEPIYRRSDVRLARSSDKWYRMGRVVRPGEQPAKFITAANKRGRDRDDDHDDESRGGSGRRRTAVFRPDQTEPYRAPAVVNGVVPKNRFRNIDVYVPAMVPAGGEHIRGASAGRAAFLIGVDYAPALTGFDFRAGFGGRRHGTAVLDGVVVASEYAAAVRAVMDGLVDLEVDAEAERRAARAMRSWRRFLIALRIHERVWAGFEGERGGGRDDTVKTADTGDRGDGGGGGFVNDPDVGASDGGGGGFLNDDGDDGGSDTGEAYSGGGFLDDEGDYGGGGGFMVE